jgi:ABC-type nickel/cobalt efflux system permease component RcnA
MRGLCVAVIAALAGLLAVPAIVFAHPLGNFTINHYAGIRVSREGVTIDFVIDRAEIPTVSEYARLDGDGDGELTDSEIETARLTVCGDLIGGLSLLVDGRPPSITVSAAGLSFPPGVGGLATMRTVCQFEARFGDPVAGRTRISFSDATDAERLGWREMTVTGDGVGIVDSPVGSDSASRRLTSYPRDLLSAPLRIDSIAFSIEPGGPPATTFVPPDARPLTAPIDRVAASSNASAIVLGPGAAIAVAVPAGIPDELSRILADPGLGFVTIVTTILLALLLGAAHALSPGHGKSVMAAYLVGTRGTASQALGLGITITVSHTTGVLILALVVLSATTVIPPESVLPVLTVASGLGFIAIGLWMLAGQLTRWRRRRATIAVATHHDHGHPRGYGQRQEVADHLEHTHGGFSHRHDPPPDDRSLTWRGLVGLGLVGGLVPSVSALVLLLGSLAAGRPAYGVVLVIAFGVGMAVVLAGIGLALVYGRELLERRVRVGARATSAALDALPVLAAAIVVAAGLYVTAGALAVRL